MPILPGRRYRPRRNLVSETEKAFSGETLQARGPFRLQGRVRRDGRRGRYLRLGVLIRKNQSIVKYRYAKNGYDLLTQARDRAVEADLNRVMPEAGHIWRGFRVPVAKIPVTRKGEIDVEFELRPFPPGRSQRIRIVYQPGTDPSFANGHYDYGVSRITRPRQLRSRTKRSARTTAGGRSSRRRTQQRSS